MKSFKMRLLVLLGASVAVLGLRAEILDRPQGIKVGQRLTLRPYVSFDFTYDSNGDQQNEAESETSWFINPHLDVNYKSDRLNADLGLFYGYRAYDSYSRQLNGHDYGENLKLEWTSAEKNEKGWTVLLNERFQRVSEDDDMRNNNGRGLWRQRGEFQIEGAIQRRITEKLHADINGSYYYLDYDNDGERYMNLYGWQRLTAGAEVGYAASRWTDFLLAGSYQSYTQDNSDDLSGNSDMYGTRGKYARESDGYSVQAGLQSHATERISYRALAGWSRFSYAGGESTIDGFIYSLSANWKISDTWNTMLLAESYYQPSETEFGTADRVDSVSWGIAHSMIRNKLNATFDAAYRRETRCYNDVSVYDYDEDIFSFRLGLDYTINRFLAVYVRGEYQACLFDGDMGGVERDYDRFRVTVGFRLQY